MIVDKNWKEVNMKEASDSEIIEFLRLNCTFSVDINCKDPIIKDWIFKHQKLIKSGNE